MGVLERTDHLQADFPKSANPDWTIPQGFERYSEAEHRTWTTLYERQAKILPGRACDAFLHGLDALDLHGHGIPDFRQLNEKLLALTGWRIVAVPGARCGVFRTSRQPAVSGRQFRPRRR